MLSFRLHAVIWLCLPPVLVISQSSDLDLKEESCHESLKVERGVEEEETEDIYQCHLSSGHESLFACHPPGAVRWTYLVRRDGGCEGVGRSWPWSQSPSGIWWELSVWLMIDDLCVKTRVDFEFGFPVIYGLNSLKVPNPQYRIRKWYHCVQTHDSSSMAKRKCPPPKKQLREQALFAWPFRFSWHEQYF